MQCCYDYTNFTVSNSLFDIQFDLRVNMRSTCTRGLLPCIQWRILIFGALGYFKVGPSGRFAATDVIHITATRAPCIH